MACGDRARRDDARRGAPCALSRRCRAAAKPDATGTPEPSAETFLSAVPNPVDHPRFRDPGRALLQRRGARLPAQSAAVRADGLRAARARRHRCPALRCWRAVARGGSTIPSACRSTGRSRRRSRPFPAPRAASPSSSSSCATSPSSAGSSRCAPTSSPMPATSCARRSPPSSASSRRCRDRPRNDPVGAGEIPRHHARAGQPHVAARSTTCSRLSRIELNAHVRPDKPVDLADHRRPCRRYAGARSRASAASTLQIERPDGALEVLGDRDELIRVFENLVENAIKYGASGKRVEIVLSRETRSGGRPAEVSGYRPRLRARASRPSICRA